MVLLISCILFIVFSPLDGYVGKHYYASFELNTINDSKFCWAVPPLTISSSNRRMKMISSYGRGTEIRVRLKMSEDAYITRDDWFALRRMKDSYNKKQEGSLLRALKTEFGSSTAKMEEFCEKMKIFNEALNEGYEIFLEDTNAELIEEGI